MSKAKKNNQISVAQINKIIAAHREDTIMISYPIDDGQVDILVLPHIAVGDRLNLIYTVVSSCFDETGEYLPAVKEIVFKHAIVCFYTNITKNIDTEVISNLIAYTDIWERLKSIIKDDMQDIANSINRVIDYMLASRMRLNNVDSACSTMANVLQNISTIVDATAASMKETNSDVSIDDIVNAAKLISRKDEKAIADAVLDYQTIKKQKMAEQKVEITGTAEHKIIKPAVFAKE